MDLTEVQRVENEARKMAWTAKVEDMHRWHKYEDDGPARRKAMQDMHNLLSRESSLGHDISRLIAWKECDDELAGPIQKLIDAVRQERAKVGERKVELRKFISEKGWSE